MYDNYNDILSIEDVCNILGIGKNTAYNLLATGELTGFKIGRIWKITKQNLQDYVSAKH